jgi:hypothetical protein
MIFCASNDNITTTEDARNFARKNKVTVVEFEGNHLGGMNVFRKDDYGDEYTNKIIEFLDRCGV